VAEVQDQIILEAAVAAMVEAAVAAMVEAAVAAMVETPEMIEVVKEKTKEMMVKIATVDVVDGNSIKLKNKNHIN
jgi:hypothetical protein